MQDLVKFSLIIMGNREYNTVCPARHTSCMGHRISNHYLVFIESITSGDIFIGFQWLDQGIKIQGWVGFVLLTLLILSK